MTTKLTKQNWLDFSLKELARHGHAQLSANRLATKLGVSRGSFYWHFKDFRDFEESLLSRWSELSTENVITDLEILESPKHRLFALMKRAMDGEMSLERSVRSWAISDVVVAKSVNAVDKRRTQYIEDILKAMDVDKVDIIPRAQMLYWASIGRMMMPEHENSDLSETELTRFADLFLS